MLKKFGKDYYWRDYDGVIPEDAFPAGRDSNDKDVYIAQIYEHNYGNMIGTIFRDKAEIEFNGYQEIKTNNSSIVKILCTQHPENFSWIPSTAERYHLDTIGKHPIPGGHSSTQHGVYYIGRIMFDGNTIIGPIEPFVNVGNAVFFFAFKNRRYRLIRSYEVLIYENTPRELSSC